MGFRQYLKSWPHLPKNARPAKKPSRRLLLEPLEDRTVPTAFNLGPLSGATFEFGGGFFGTDTYQFSVSEPAVLDIQAEDSNLFAPFAGDVAITLSRASNAAVLASSSHPQDSESIHLSVSADTYILTVTDQGNTFLAGSAYDLTVAVDLAGGQRVLQNGTLIGFEDNSGRELGTLTETPGSDPAHDFVGYLFETDLLAPDLTDVYLFTVPATGHVTLSVNGLDPSPDSDNPLDLTATLLRDTDHDGVFSLISSSENLSHGALTSPTDRFVFDGNLNPGRYALALTAADQSLSGGNYDLNIVYDVPDDSAGNSLATARDLGSAGSLPTTANNYLSSVDPLDMFKFTVSGGGPFNLHATLTNMLPGTDFDVDVIQDANNNGKVDTGEVLASGTNPIGNEDSFVNTLAGGTFYLRVQQVSGEGPFTVGFSSSNLDHAGNTLATATNIGNPFLGRTHLADFVSSSDSADIYKFTIATAGTISASFPDTALNTDADLALIQDVNGNGTVDAGDILVSSATNRSNAGEGFSRAVAAGTYYVRVLQRAGSPAYDMTLTVDTAGNTPATALAMGLSGNAASTIEFIGPGDAADFYKVSVAAPLQLNVFFSLFGEPFTVTIGQDPNGDGLIDRTEALLTKTIATADDVRQVVNLPGKGVYFVKITSAGTLGTNYGIVFATAPVDNAGDTPAAARNVGVLGATTRTFIDFVGDGSIDVNARGNPVLGADDVDDYYRFTLGTQGPYRFTGQISGLTGNADLQLIRDDNLNQKVDADKDEVLATSSNLGTTTDTIAMTLVTPGTYYLRVFRPGSGTTGSANYTLTMTAVSTDTAGNTLKTAKNKGALTTSTTINDAEFVGAIDLHDFYSFTVPGPGILTVGRNTSVAGIGIEVLDASGKVLANSGGTQTASGLIAFSAQLPAAGTYFVHALTSGINANYSLSLSFANPTAGTFVLAPSDKTVHAAEHVKLALDWTVPEGSWHTLQYVDLRLRDRFGTVALIRFYEADNTVSLFDPLTGTFGPAKALGSPGFLENGFVKIFLKTSSVKAAGPTSPTVSLTFDIQFKEPAYGRSFFIEAAAGDDLGQVQDFAFAGMIDVLGSQDDKHK